MRTKHFYNSRRSFYLHSNIILFKLLLSHCKKNAFAINFSDTIKIPFLKQIHQNPSLLNLLRKYAKNKDILKNTSTQFHKIIVSDIKKLKIITSSKLPNQNLIITIRKPKETRTISYFSFSLSLSLYPFL